MSTYYEVAKKSFYKFLKENKIKNKFLEDFVENNRFGFLSLIRLAKLEDYPFNWLSGDQRNFLIQGGEEWLFRFLGGLSYLEKGFKPGGLERYSKLFDRSPEYRELEVAKISKIINKILEEKNIQFFRVYNTYFERFVRLKIEPGGYKKFYYIIIPVGFLYGMVEKRFDFTDKERGYGEFLTLYFLNEFLDSFLFYKLEDSIKSVNTEQINKVQEVLEKIKGKVIGLDIIIDKLKELEDKVIKLREFETLQKEMEEYAKTKKINPKTKEKVEEIEKEIQDKIPYKTQAKFKEITGYSYTALIQHLEKEQLTQRTHDKLKNLAKELEEKHGFIRVSELIKELLKNKDIVNNKGIKSRSVSIPKEIEDVDLKIKLAEEYEKSLKEKGLMRKNTKLLEEKKKELGEILYKMRDIFEDKNISLNKVTFFLK